ncbi:MAG: aminoglycoside phosphotransferase family protein [Reichenbachiella sp.]|uniref:phosphotransferase enzyme family protein n=2 Tax=Reichenbachiella sp. TaxID=2184521 RepID=UPI003264CE8E
MANIQAHYGTNMNDVLDIAQQFRYIESAKATRLASGNIQETFLISGPEGSNDFKFILQKINTSIFLNPEHLIENHQRLEKHLASEKRELIIPRLMKNLEGSMVLHQGSSCWRAQEFVPQSRTFEQVPNSDIAFEGAFMVGQFTASFLDLDPTNLHTIIPEFHNLKRYLNEFHLAIEADVANRLSSCADELNRISELETAMVALFENTRSLPNRVCHNDTKISNILFDMKSNKAIKVIDLDTVMLEKVIFDYGDMVRSFLCLADENETDISKVVVRGDIFEAMTKGYLSVTKSLLEKNEKRELFSGGLLITYEQVVRFLGDYLRNDTYYHTDYTNHNLDRAKNQIRVLDQLLEREAEFIKIIEKYS